jgi:hypothetical protein
VKCKKSLGFGGAGALLVISFSLAYGFRTETREHPTFGTTHNTYRFWKPSSISFDTNHDGKVDAIGILREGADSFKSPLSEYLEDRDFDGHLEIRALYKDGVLNSVEVDKDGDGIPEEVHEGEEAAKDFFLQFVPKE